MSESPTFDQLIEQWVREAESHMELPDGTISNTWHDSDFLYVVKMCAVLEPLLKDVVRKHVKRHMERASSFKSETLIKEIGNLDVDKLRKILVEYNSISKELSDFIHALFQVRHRYAHHIRNAHLTVAEVCDKIAESGGDATLLDKLVGNWDKQLTRNQLTSLSYLRVILAVKIALVLQAALHLAKPPPPLPTALGGGLFGGTLFDTPLALKPKEIPPP